MLLCPFCGHQLASFVKDGAVSCPHCSRIFDTSPFNRIMSAAWSVKKNPELTIERLEDYGVIEEEAVIAYTFIAEHAYSIEEFAAFLKSIGVSQTYLA